MLRSCRWSSRGCECTRALHKKKPSLFSPKHPHSCAHTHHVSLSSRALPGAQRTSKSSSVSSSRQMRHVFCRLPLPCRPNLGLPGLAPEISPLLARLAAALSLSSGPGAAPCSTSPASGLPPGGPAPLPLLLASASASEPGSCSEPAGRPPRESARRSPAKVLARDAFHDAELLEGSCPGCGSRPLSSTASLGWLFTAARAGGLGEAAQGGGHRRSPRVRQRGGVARPPEGPQEPHRARAGPAGAVSPRWKLLLGMAYPLLLPRACKGRCGVTQGRGAALEHWEWGVPATWAS